LKRCDNARKSLIAIAAILFLGTPAHADFMEGWRAYQRGDFETALEQWTSLAERGDPVAQYNVGVMYDEGTGVETNVEKIIGWWRKAADQGHRMAQHNLALLFIERGSGNDVQQAVTLLKAAAAVGFTPSQHSLGKLYAVGLGVEKDHARALQLTLRAGKAGFVKSQYSLGKFYRDGVGVESDQAESVAWFRRAAEQGYARAQERLATRYADGKVVERDLVEALKWATLAAGRGMSAALEIRTTLLGIMNPEQIVEAERLAEEFRPKDGGHVPARNP
jgi:hypothetical protein